MRSFTKPVVVISKCLGTSSCRWDGVSRLYPFVRQLKPYVRLVPVCPELEIGLGVPRDRICLVESDRGLLLHQPATGRELTRRMERFTHRYLNALDSVDGFILKSKSPSCGIRTAKVFFSPSEDSKAVSRASGLFAAQVLEGFGYLAVEDEARLENTATREHWLTKLFALAQWRIVRNSGSLQRMINSHTRQRSLLFSYNAKQTRMLDRIVVGCNDKLPRVAFSEYDSHFISALRRKPRRSSMVKAFLPALAHYTSYLDTSEKRRFRRSLEKYGRGEIPLSDIRKTVQVWGVRYDKTFLRAHSIYRPYPGELAK